MPYVCDSELLWKDVWIQIHMLTLSFWIIMTKSLELLFFQLYLFERQRGIVGVRAEKEGGERTSLDDSLPKELKHT